MACTLHRQFWQLNLGECNFGKAYGTRYDDGLEMVKACDDANVRLFVVKQNRRNATLQLLKKTIDDNLDR